MMAQAQPIDEISHLFRHSYGKILAALVNKFGSHHLEDIEDAVQDALLKGMQIWSFQGMPQNPTAWLLVVARNNILDLLRRRSTRKSFEVKQTEASVQIAQEDVFLDGIIVDDQLRLIFACCHPKLSQESQIILTLKLVAGFSNREVAHALLKKEETIAKAFTRAKQKLKREVPSLTIPIEMGLRSRLNIVLKIIYLVFSEGYAASSGPNVIKRDLCFEAIRLALLLTNNKFCNRPNVHALIALMCFHASRLDARIDRHGHFLDLEHQDRAKWNRELMEVGQSYLAKATQGEKPTNYLFQALISYQHCIAATFGDTDWQKILTYYDLELRRNYSPLVELNRLIPLHQIQGAEIAFTELMVYANKSHAIKGGLYYAFKAKLLEELQRRDEAVIAYERALTFVSNDVERNHLVSKLASLKLYL